MKETHSPLNPDYLLKIGDIFTPLPWAEFAVETFDIFSQWMQGATIFDPTMGEGNLLEALITYGLKQGYSLTDLPISQLFGNELNHEYYQNALAKFQEKYAVDMQQNFSNADFLLLPEKRYDLLLGNPPWQNFVDLPEGYKEKIKHQFFKYDLVANSRNLLLGGSRIDIAALMIQRGIRDFLKPNGRAFFFMPLSLLLNDGANKQFRTYKIREVNYAVEAVWDFDEEDIFKGIATRYGLVHFSRDTEAHFPIPYKMWQEEEWKDYEAKPLFEPNDPLSVFLGNEEALDSLQIITLKQESTPRQGINTGGANEVFFFDSLVPLDEQLVSVSNKTQQNILLPRAYLYPLISNHAFKSEENPPNKWVLLPYHNNGKALELAQIKAEKTLYEYLLSHQTTLENRKGIMLNTLIKRGTWWALLGVGAYNFFPYKIVWEAYGKTAFNPKIFTGNYQANQSLQAYIPLRTLAEAEEILSKLKDKRVEEYLLSLKMKGTMNWAQPGKIKKILHFQDESLRLF